MDVVYRVSRMDDVLSLDTLTDECGQDVWNPSADEVVEEELLELLAGRA
jgi:hypothetical protein